MYKRLLIVAALMTALSGLAGLTTASANSLGQEQGKELKQDKSKEEDKNPGDKKDKDEADNNITICHRTNATNNPYLEITVDKNAVDGDGHDDHTSHTGPLASSFIVATTLKAAHTKWGDIIPAFGDYAGYNWTTEGKAMHKNGCKFTSTTSQPMIDYDVICEVASSRAKITLTNTGSADGTAIVNGTTITVAANDEEVTYVSTPSGKTKITIVIDGITVYDEALDCRAGGQGGDKEPEITTPIVTPTTPAGQSGAAATPSIASLPYTAGETSQPIALIVSAIAAVVAIAATIVKKAYLKQI